MSRDKITLSKCNTVRMDTVLYMICGAVTRVKSWERTEGTRMQTWSSVEIRSVPSNTTLQCHNTVCCMVRFIRTIMGHLFLQKVKIHLTCVTTESTRYSCQIVVKLGIYRRIFEKYLNIKFYENPSIGSRVVYKDGQTDVTKLIVAFRNFAMAPKNVKGSS
jgi:hypothetical protein